MSRELIQLLLAWAAGLGFGLFYFGGLWLTIRRLPTTRWPGALTLGSLAGRMAVTLIGFFLATAGRWDRLLACLAGFMLMRFVVVAWLRPEDEPPSPLDEGES